MATGSNRKVVLNIFLFSITPRLDAILSLFIFPLITPFLTEEDFGIWGIVSSYFGLGLAISTLGLEVNFTNAFFTHRSRFAFPWRVLSGLSHYAGILFSILFGIIIYQVLPPLEHKLLLVVIASAPIFFQNINAIAMRLFLLREQALPITYRKLFAAILSVAATYLIIAVFRLGFWGWAVAYLVNAAFFYFSFIPFLYVREGIWPRLRLRWARVKASLKVSVPIIPYTLALVLLSSSDRIIMERLNVPVGDIGIYSLSYRMANYMFTLVAGVTAALTPRLQQYYRSGRFDKFMRISWLAYLLVLMCTVSGSLMMEEVFQVLVRNEALHVAAPLASIAVFAASFHVWYFVISMPLFINEKTRLLPLLILIPAGVSILLNIFLIPAYGFQVALWVTFFSYMLTPWIGLAFPFIRKLAIQMMPHVLRDLSLVTLANTLLLLCCYQLTGASPWIRSGLAAGMIILLAFLAWKKGGQEFFSLLKRTKE
ncbi:MAG TPA: hypothetical protein P5550_00500 [Bacteroidales bacterium]|nr:hypothetical protein [Bacteroidales bacterium]